MSSWSASRTSPSRPTSWERSPPTIETEPGRPRRPCRGHRRGRRCRAAPRGSPRRCRPRSRAAECRSEDSVVLVLRVHVRFVGADVLGTVSSVAASSAAASVRSVASVSVICSVWLSLIGDLLVLGSGRVGCWPRGAGVRRPRHRSQARRQGCSACAGRVPASCAGCGTASWAADAGRGGGAPLQPPARGGLAAADPCARPVAAAFRAVPLLLGLRPGVPGAGLFRIT